MQWETGSAAQNLSEVRSCTHVMVMDILCKDPACRARLAELGLFAGAEVEVAANCGVGPLIVKIDQSARFGLDRSLAKSVEVVSLNF